MPPSDSLSWSSSRVEDVFAETGFFPFFVEFPASFTFFSLFFPFFPSEAPGTFNVSPISPRLAPLPLPLPLPPVVPIPAKILAVNAALLLE